MAKKAIKDSPLASATSEPNDDWEVKNHARTIMEAHEIMADPTKMKKVMKHFKGQKKQIRSIQDLHNYRNEKYGSGSQAGPDDEASEGE